MNNFWQQLPKGFTILAPMDDVTDVIFRQLVANVAAPEVLFTEFVSTDGLQSAGRERTMERLRVEPNLTRPLVVQIWGSDPEKYRQTAQDVADMGFAGIDINLGCPEKGIVARGCCGGLIGQYDRVADIIAAAKAGAPNLPVSVKTRIGLREIITEEWTSFLLKQDITALTMHGRTVKEMSKVPAHWDEIAKIVPMRDQLAPHTVVIGNGDVRDRAHAQQLVTETGLDGIMIGRGIFHDIFAFAQSPHQPTPEERLDILQRHLALYEQWGSTKPFHILKKFFKIYVAEWPGAAELRSRLMEANSVDEVRAILAGAKVPVAATV
jgi:tRNA-dihydrouridine synthase